VSLGIESVRVERVFDFDNSFARELPELGQPWSAATVPEPRLVALNRTYAAEIGIDVDALDSSEGLAVFAGNAVPDGAEPLAQAYAGHQFGGFSPRLGDGRALLLGEHVAPDGRRVDVHLKGSGRTPFARGGDGKAVLGPMLREFVMCEAMAALRVSTTRALAVVSTGEQVVRETLQPGAIFTRLAASHLRVGTFQYAATLDDPQAGADLLPRLLRYAAQRHHPAVLDTANPALGFIDAVMDVQARLVARWMSLGFIHGVMNTDNVTISGETIDYGPCAFMDAYEPSTVFSSIDHGGRYAYGNQPHITQWNMARLAETLLPLIDGDLDTAIGLATDLLHAFPERYEHHAAVEMAAKLSLDVDHPDAARLVADLLTLMHADHVDWTSCFRSLSAAAAGDRETTRRLFVDLAGIDAWLDRWLPLVADDPTASTRLDSVNPIYIPRNHLVEEALQAAMSGDLAPFEQLAGVLADPFTRRDGLDRYAVANPDDSGRYRTFCGT
jgi:serine/tyrosine/threonine adenylyltransferase